MHINVTTDVVATNSLFSFTYVCYMPDYVYQGDYPCCTFNTRLYLETYQPMQDVIEIPIDPHTALQWGWFEETDYPEIFVILGAR